jgi:hypothetical protein
VEAFIPKTWQIRKMSKQRVKFQLRIISAFIRTETTRELGSESCFGACCALKKVCKSWPFWISSQDG